MMMAKENLMSEEQLIIIEERNTKENLLIELKTIEDEIMNIKEKLGESNEDASSNLFESGLEENAKLINNKKLELIETLKRYYSMKQSLQKSITANLELSKELKEEIVNKDIAENENKELELIQSYYHSQIKPKEIEINRIQNDVNLLHQMLNSIEVKSSHVEEKLPPFVKEIKNKFSAEISTKEINLLESLNLNELSSYINDEIIQFRQEINKVKNIVKNFKDQCIVAEIQERRLGNTASELEMLQNQHSQIALELEQLTAYNNNLDTNMEEEVEKVIRDKVEAISKDSFENTCKYLQAGEYILEIIGVLLENEEREQFYNETEKTYQIATEKLKHFSSF